MKQYFSFNPYSHDFWPILEAIKTYYPIGIKFSDRFLYTQYPGQKKLAELLVDNFQTRENYKERFGGFLTTLKSQFGLEIVNTTYGQQPAFNLDLILERTEAPGLNKIKKLCVAISLLGEFYAIFGIDQTVVLIDEGGEYPRQYYANNAVTISPYMEFEQPYLDLKKIVQAQYPNHKQIPFGILATYMEGVHDAFKMTNECMIYNALFDQTLDHDYTMQIRGDQYYAYDEWVKEGFDESNFSSVEVIVIPPPPVQPPPHLI